MKKKQTSARSANSAAATPMPVAKTDAAPLISCLTITQAGRLHLLQRALSDFARQSWAPRELVIVHDGGQSLQQQIEALLINQQFATAPVRVVTVASGQTLGALRNRSLDLARGEFVCQWDDDDRYHPQRLALQFAALQQQQAEACFLVDQLHFFEAEQLLYWDDWNLERYPYNLIPGTLLARGSCLGRYPEQRRGEDSVLVDEMLRRQVKIARLREHGWLYVYGYSGNNTFEAEHHQAISRSKPMRSSRVLGLEPQLRAALAQYLPALGPARLALARGELLFAGMTQSGR